MSESESKHIRTNEEFLGELMMFSPYGALCQVFIIEAIRNYAERVSNSPTPIEHGTGVFSEIAWHGVGVDILKKLKDNYEPAGS